MDRQWIAKMLAEKRSRWPSGRRASPSRCRTQLATRTALPAERPREAEINHWATSLSRRRMITGPSVGHLLSPYLILLRHFEEQLISGILGNNAPAIRRHWAAFC